MEIHGLEDRWRARKKKRRLLDHTSQILDFQNSISNFQECFLELYI